MLLRCSSGALSCFGALTAMLTEVLVLCSVVLLCMCYVVLVCCGLGAM